jgi:hypothetical protein
MKAAVKSLVLIFLSSLPGLLNAVDLNRPDGGSPGKSYAEIKAEVLEIRSRIDTTRIAEDSLSRLFTHLLVRKIISPWYGTTWSFEGHSAVPRDGEIACGYFVSTTLRDMGLNLNRYKLAQQLPVHEAKSLSIDGNLMEVANDSVQDNIDELQALLKEGIYFIGFDQSHVGYILKKEGQLYLIHSNYINSQGVIMEKIEDSEAFSYYNRFYIAEISTNKNLLRKWVLNEEIAVVTE